MVLGCSRRDKRACHCLINSGWLVDVFVTELCRNQVAERAGFDVFKHEANFPGYIPPTRRTTSQYSTPDWIMGKAKACRDTYLRTSA